MLELLMLKHDLLFVPDGDFTASDIDEAVSYTHLTLPTIYSV